MGDADGSYDFEEIPRFLEELREGYAPANAFSNKTTEAQGQACVAR